MSLSCRVTTVKNSPQMSLLRIDNLGGSVLYAPLALGSMRIDDLVPVVIIAACAPLLLC
jgi:hypothetical protein